jgi:hypothetical protein
MEEVLNDNANYEENAKMKCKNQFDTIYGLIKNRVEGIGGSESPSSTSLGSRNSSQNTVKRASGTGKENSPTKKTRLKSCRSSKELFKDVSIDSRPSKEKRTKQTKLPFFTTSSAKKRRSRDLLDDDEDMTYCEEIERGLINPNAAAANKSNNNDTPDIFNFGTLENFKSRKSKEKTSTAVENPKELTPQKVLGIKIKSEKKDNTSLRAIPPPFSPDLFLSDLSNSNNSVIFIEPPEKEVISISDRTYNPSRNLLQEIQKEIKHSRNKLFEDSDPIPTPPKIPIEERDPYENECMECQVFYDDIAEKKSVFEANTEINNCPIKCDGWKARCRKLRKDDKSRKNGMVIIKCNTKFARRRKEDTINETAPGIWDLEVEPRKSKPLFRKQNNENYETPDL